MTNGAPKSYIWHFFHVLNILRRKHRQTLESSVHLMM